LQFEYNKIVPLQLFSGYFTFIVNLSPAVSKKIHIFLKFSWKQRYLVIYIGKQKNQVTNIGLKSTIVIFAPMTFKTVFTNGNWKLFLGLERKHKHETYTLLTLCLINFLCSHIPLIFISNIIVIVKQ